jgi:hypothetical protein
MHKQLVARPIETFLHFGRTKAGSDSLSDVVLLLKKTHPTPALYRFKYYGHYQTHTPSYISYPRGHVDDPIAQGWAS